MNHSIVPWLEKQLGIHEATGQNDGAPWRLYCHGETPPPGLKGWEWCAAMLVEGFKQVGFPLPGKWRENWRVATMFAELRKAGAIVPLEEAKPGDLIAFPRGSFLFGHVEGVISATRNAANGDQWCIETIGGNVANAVRRQHHVFTARVGAPIWAPDDRYTPTCTIACWPLDAALPDA